jgi:hypothetical protein
MFLRIKFCYEMSQVVSEERLTIANGYNDRRSSTRPGKFGKVSSAFPYYMLAFKICLDEDDHWLNKMAVWSTSTVRDDPSNFEGMVSHVEALFAVVSDTGKNEHTWYRYSVMKSRGLRGPDNKITWKPGVVHRIKTGSDFVSKYRFYKIDAKQEEVDAALRFADSQVGSPFNFNGYVINFYSPFKLGVRNHREATRRGDKGNSWFCSELVVCICQVAGLEESKFMKACAVSPNALYRVVAKNEAYRTVMIEVYIV